VELNLFLKSLDILGFKSFADRTRVEFADGITALLGPNGCGKSNVVDAIKWVLGEQASKSLRAEKMEDVIFNGTETRKALNVAEVTLTLANDAGLLAIDMPEIQIKRRLYRSGESEYFINQTPVKLKDVRELFWDTGVGKAAYSVMEQGKIDQVLSSKPDERRYLFEEAAGITRFKVRGAEAERKLERTEENMRQVEGILGEVRRLCDSLKVQADKTIKYRALRDEIFNNELDIQLLRLKQFNSERDRRSGELASRTKERDTVNSEIAAINRSLEENMDVVNAMEAQLIDRQKRIYGLAVEKNGKEKEAKLLVERRTESKAKIQQNESREKAVKIKIEELLEDADEQEGVVRDLKKRVEDIEKNIVSFEENVAVASARMGENDKAAHRAEADIIQAEEARADFERQLETITDDIVAELDARLKDLGYSAQERRRAEEELDATLGRLRTLLAGRESLFKDFSDAVARAISGGALPSNQELKKIAEGAVAAFAEAAREADRSRELFEHYRKTTPAFIDEFLSPEGIMTKKRALDAKVRGLKETVLGLRERITVLRGENEGLGTKIDEYRRTLEELRVNRVRMATQAQSAEEQARLIRRELAGQENLLKTVQDELFLDKKRFEEIADQIEEAEADIADIERRGRQLSSELESLEKDIASRNGDVTGKQEALKKRLSEMGRIQQALEKLHMDLVQTETELRNIQDNFRETHSRDLMEFEERMYTITTPTADLRDKLAAARSALKDLGSVNLMAPDEYVEAKDRYDFLSGQLADLKKARDDLARITAEIRAESSELFINTYNKIKKNFHNMFRRLFGGGRAELRLSDPNHVLESGIEIFAQPPGKKLENITLLSGGEKSMTAVALLFATYMVKPSPFCLLDEIDAALDEHNVVRFVQLLREFGNNSQFIVITHNKKTVTGARTLLGVTMEESGITKVISVRLENEESDGYESSMPEETYEDEEVEIEVGAELPPGIDDPSLVDEATLHPIRTAKRAAALAAEATHDVSTAPPDETVPTVAMEESGDAGIQG